MQAVGAGRALISESGHLCTSFCIMAGELHPGQKVRLKNIAEKARGDSHLRLRKDGKADMSGAP